MKRNNIFLVVLITMIFSSSLVISLGIASEYWSSNPLYLSPGESKDVKFTIQNMVGEEDATIRFDLIGGNEIATFIDSSNIYNVPAKTEDVSVNLRISIPSNAKIGNSYIVTGTFAGTTGDQSSGQFKFGSAFENSFEVIVKEKVEVAQPLDESSEISYGVIIAVALIVLIIIILVMIFATKKKNKK